MEPLITHLRIPAPTQSKKTQRGELLRDFCERINATREGTQYPRITMPRMGKILEGIDTQWLHYLMRICKDSNNFSATFFWRLRKEKEAVKQQTNL